MNESEVAHMKEGRKEGTQPHRNWWPNGQSSVRPDPAARLTAHFVSVQPPQGQSRPATHLT